jgi:hypothetical protein
MAVEGADLHVSHGVDDGARLLAVAVQEEDVQWVQTLLAPDPGPQHLSESRQRAVREPSESRQRAVREPLHQIQAHSTWAEPTESSRQSAPGTEGRLPAAAPIFASSSMARAKKNRPSV